MKVLVAEDDTLIRRAVVEVLADEGYQVLQASDGQTALTLFHEHRPDFVFLDVMMPEVNGFDVCRKLRDADAEVPIVFISAKSEEVDKVVGLELGADDFIVKPFGVKELVARIRSITRRCHRRSQTENGGCFQMLDLDINTSELRGRRGEQVIELSLRDVRLLQLLHDHRGEVLDRATIFDRVWGEDYFPNSRTLDQHVSRLRKRIEIDPNRPVLIRTVHGVGYRYDG
ncbi:Alkaline phosphatase synthesis transcriptional regulatory protein SphR [Symmachiella macrocystis]|uniref:Alkaline phosphatase synthesis transcriptional regulatory protein SphR n=1 Tax=Symmachiella macrocystis TaxID=2527985 RepID=A0A5C6B7E4_9PLAN|nr:response regulator transcription factor [Symmachiella macrocystis]TWU07216.1 Alkaline phosphatase synthesis transcriptional regulatory protein SphR [Symmachiella macrocystis]